MLGKCSEFAVGNFIANESSSKRDRIDGTIGQLRPLVAFKSGLHKRQIESDVVSDDHGIADELKQRRQHRFDARSGHHHRMSDSGEHRDRWWNRTSWIYKCLKRSEAFTSPEFHCANFGNAARCS